MAQESGSPQITGFDILNAASAYSGVRYFEGNPQNRQNGFDCSGIVQQAMADLGVMIPRTTSTQLAAAGLQNIGTDINKALQGDIIHYVGHEEIFIGWWDGHGPMVFSESVPGEVAAVRGQTPWPIIGIVRYANAGPGPRSGSYGAINVGGPHANPNSAGQSGGDPGKVSGQAVDIIPGAHTVVDAIQQIWGVLSGFVKFLNDITNPGFWQRVGLGFLGLVLLIIGLSSLSKGVSVASAANGAIGKIPLAS